MADLYNEMADTRFALAHSKEVVVAAKRHAMHRAASVGIAVASVNAIIAIIFHLKALQWTNGTWKLPLVIISLALVGPIFSILCGIGAGLLAYVRFRPSEQGVPVALKEGSVDIEETLVRTFAGNHRDRAQDDAEVEAILSRFVPRRPYTPSRFSASAIA